MKKILFTILIAGAVAVGIYLYRSGALPDGTMTEQKDEGMMPVRQPGKVAEHGNADIQVIQLKAVGEHEGSGTASRRYDGTTFVHTVGADLPEPAPEKFYEGWLVRREPFRFMSTGELQLIGGVYTLQFVSQTDLTAYSQVVITEESLELGLDGMPETHVLEGSF